MKKLNPPESRTINLKTKLALILGGSINILGWFFITILVAFTVTSDIIQNGVHYSGTFKELPGTITTIEKDGFNDDEEQIYKIHYRFKDHEGISVSGYSYDTETGLTPGVVVAIEYNVSNPEYHKIKGLRTTNAETDYLISYLIGLFLAMIALIFGYRMGRKNLYLLQNGITIEGRLKEGHISRMDLKDIFKQDLHLLEKNKYTYTYQFKRNKKEKLLVTGATHDPEWINGHKPSTTIIYNPDLPEHNAILGLMPGVLQIDDVGNPVATSKQWLWEPFFMIMTALFLIYLVISLF